MKVSKKLYEKIVCVRFLHSEFYKKQDDLKNSLREMIEDPYLGVYTDGFGIEITGAALNKWCLVEDFLALYEIKKDMKGGKIKTSEFERLCDLTKSKDEYFLYEAFFNDIKRRLSDEELKGIILN